MKKEYKNKLIEIGGYCICLTIILAIGYFSGYLKGFAPDDFVNAYEQITADLSKSSAVKNTNVSFSRTKSIGSKTTSTYNDYQAARIPVAVIRGVNTSRTWTEIFNSQFFTYMTSKMTVLILQLKISSTMEYCHQSILFTLMEKMILAICVLEKLVHPRFVIVYKNVIK